MNCREGCSPPGTGGVAAPVRKRREASEAAQTGWSLTVHVDVVTLSGTDQRGRRWPSRRLPFVAAGVDSPDLPACIFHAPGDPAVIAPEEGRYRYFLSWPLNTKAFQSNKAESIEDFVLELQMVTTAFRLGFHAAEPHANPTIQAIERRPASEEPRCKVSSSTPNNPVEFNHLSLSRLSLRQVSSRTLSFKFP